MEKHEIIKSNNLNEVRKKIDKFAKENKKITMAVVVVIIIIIAAIN